MGKIKFKETQRYNNKLVPVVLAVVAILSIARGGYFLMKNEPNVSSAIFLFVVAGLCGGIIWWLTSLKLKVTIAEKKVKFKFSPLHIRTHTIPWKKIESAEIIETSKAAQWSGGNITFSPEKSFSLSGRNGLAIKTKKGEHYFIGCSDVDELQKTLDEMKIKKK